MIPILRTDRLILRPLTVADAPALFAARSDPEVMRYWDWPAQRTVAEIETIVTDHQPAIAAGEAMWWAVALSAQGPAIGECDLSEIDSRHQRAELGFLFARDHWGQGYGLEAAKRVVDYALSDLGLERLWARVHAGNERSCRLLEHLGFVYEGTLKGQVRRDGARRDCIVYGKLKS